MDRFDHKRIKRLVDAQGRRVIWLAAQTGYDHSYVSRLLNGKVPVTDEAANRIARALQVPVSYFEGPVESRAA